MIGWVVFSSHAVNAQAAPPAAGADMQVLSWQLNTTGDTVQLIGNVRNLTQASLTGVVILVTLMDTNGRNFFEGQALLDADTLGAGSTTTFKTEPWKRSATPWNAEMERADIARAIFGFRTTSGKMLNGVYSSSPGNSGESQLKALNEQGNQVYEERRRREAEIRERSRRQLPAWWPAYESAMKPLRSAERALRSAYREEGDPAAVVKEIRALRGPLMAVAQNLEPSPDPTVQRLVGDMLLSLASAIEKADAGSAVGFREDYAKAISLLRKLDQRRAASP